MKKTDERYSLILFLSVCNIIVFFAWFLLFLYCEGKDASIRELLFLPVLYLEIYEVLYYKKSPQKVRKEISEKCWGRSDLPFHPYFILIVYGGLCVIFTAIDAYFTFLR